MKKIAKTLFRAVLVAAALIVIISAWDMIGRWLVVIFGGLGSWFFARKALDQERVQEIQKREEELDQAADDRQKQAEILAREDEKQQEAIEDWRERKNRWKSRISLMLIFCVLLMVTTPAWAEEEPYADLTKEELVERLIEAEKLLDEADRLLTREMALKEQYKALYLEAEADLQTARYLSEQKNDIIASLKKSNQAWGIIAGIDLGDSARWRVGVARKKGWLSFGAGIGGGDRFSVWGSVTLWLQNPF